MSAILHSVLMILAISAAYFWLQIPGLSQFSLQVFAFCIAVYLLLKRAKNAELWHIAPAAHSLELAVLSFAFLILIGSTGAIHSVLYPLSYVLLFFIVFSSRASTAILAVLTMCLYFYVLSPDVTHNGLSLLATLPLLFVFFLFAKAQYQAVAREQADLTKGEDRLSQYSSSHQQLTTFVSAFVQPKLEYMTKLLDYPADNKHTLLSQIALLQVEIEKMVHRLADSLESVTETEGELPPSSQPTTEVSNMAENEGDSIKPDMTAKTELTDSDHATETSV